MVCFEIIDGNYILSIGQSDGKVGNLISEERYEKIRNLKDNKPSSLPGYTHKLRADNLKWDLVELPPVEPEPVTDEEALTRYANELTGADDPDLISAAETLITERIKEES